MAANSSPCCKYFLNFDEELPMSETNKFVLYKCKISFSLQMFFLTDVLFCDEEQIYFALLSFNVMAS